jgi:hypothetical protein
MTNHSFLRDSSVNGDDRALLALPDPTLAQSSDCNAVPKIGGSLSFGPAGKLNASKSFWAGRGAEVSHAHLDPTGPPVQPNYD